MPTPATVGAPATDDRHASVSLCAGMAVVGGTPPSDDDRHCYAVFAPVLPTPPVPRCRPQRHTECDDCASLPCALRLPQPSAIRGAPTWLAHPESHPLSSCPPRVFLPVRSPSKR